MYRTLLLFLLCSTCGVAGFGSSTAGGRHASLAGADIARAGSVWSLAINPATLQDITYLTGSFSLSPQPFGIRELYSVSVAIAAPGLLGVCGLGACRFGCDLFRQITLTACYANSFAGVDFGFGLNYYSYSIARYGSAGTFGIDMGARIPLNRMLAFAFTGENINSPAIGSISDKLPQSFSLGVAWSPLETFSAELDYREEDLYEGSPSMGVEYRPVSYFIIRLGFRESPAIVTGGFGVSWSFGEIDYA